MRFLNTTRRKVRQAGVTLVETMVGMGVFGIGTFSLYAGISLGFSIVNHTREELRATQIMVEKMETIRLYSWDQINTTNFIPTTFTEHYYPAGVGQTNGWSSGVVYTGSVTFAASPSTPSYSTNLLKVTIGLNWATDETPRSKTLSTYVSRDGLQKYIY